MYYYISIPFELKKKYEGERLAIEETFFVHQHSTSIPSNWFLSNTKNKDFVRFRMINWTKILQSSESDITLGQSKERVWSAEEALGRVTCTRPRDTRESSRKANSFSLCVRRECVTRCGRGRYRRSQRNRRRKIEKAYLLFFISTTPFGIIHLFPPRIL